MPHKPLHKVTLNPPLDSLKVHERLKATEKLFNISSDFPFLASAASKTFTCYSSSLLIELDELTKPAIVEKAETHNAKAKLKVPSNH